MKVLRKPFNIPVDKFFFSSSLTKFSKPFLKIKSLTGTFKDYCQHCKNNYLAECLLKVAGSFIWPAFINQEFFIPPRPASKIGQCVDLLKRIKDANQRGIHQVTFRVSSVLHLYAARSSCPAAFVKVCFKTTATFLCHSHKQLHLRWWKALGFISSW